MFRLGTIVFIASFGLIAGVTPTVASEPPAFGLVRPVSNCVSIDTEEVPPHISVHPENCP